MEAAVYNAEHKKIGTMEVPDRVFNAPWRPDLVHQVLVALQANARQPLAHTKGRGEVRGGGKKPWRQKGTGRARHGSIRSPLWKGGGITFGPTNLREFAKKINKKTKRAALCSLLSKKMKDGEITIVDDFGITEPKTKRAASFLRAYALHTPKKKESVLLVPDTTSRLVIRAGRNLPHCSVTYPQNLGLEACLAHKVILFEKKGIAALAEKDITGK